MVMGNLFFLFCRVVIVFMFMLILVDLDMFWNLFLELSLILLDYKEEGLRFCFNFIVVVVIIFGCVIGVVFFVFGFFF